MIPMDQMQINGMHDMLSQQVYELAVRTDFLLFMLDTMCHGEFRKRFDAVIEEVRDYHVKLLDDREEGLKKRGHTADDIKKNDIELLGKIIDVIREKVEKRDSKSDVKPLGEAELNSEGCHNVCFYDAKNVHSSLYVHRDETISIGSVNLNDDMVKSLIAHLTKWISDRTLEL